jgi:hypothetical protein
MYEAPDGPSRPCVRCRHSTGRCGEILQHEVQRCYLLKKGRFGWRPLSSIFPERLSTASGWKPSGISGTVATSAALQIGQGAPTLRSRRLPHLTWSVAVVRADPAAVVTAGAHLHLHPNIPSGRFIAGDWRLTRRSPLAGGAREGDLSSAYVEARWQPTYQINFRQNGPNPSTSYVSPVPPGWQGAARNLGT